MSGGPTWPLPNSQTYHYIYSPRKRAEGRDQLRRDYAGAAGGGAGVDVGASAASAARAAAASCAACAAA
eukprot:scaffold1431_cov59-Phaeocystis_antarctica.AAC.3